MRTAIGICDQTGPPPATEIRQRQRVTHVQEDRRCAKDKVREVITKLRAMRLTRAAELVEATELETLTYFTFPSNHWRQIKTNNPLERVIRDIHRRTRVVGAFPDGHSPLMLVAARLRRIASTMWVKRRYLAMETLLNPLPEGAAA